MIGAVGLWITTWTHWPHAYAISLGLVVDELTYLAIGGKTHQDNYSVPSLVGTIAMVVVVFLLRNLLFRPVL